MFIYLYFLFGILFPLTSALVIRMSKRKKTGRKTKRDKGVPESIGSYKRDPEEIQVVGKTLFDRISQSTSKIMSKSGKIVYYCTIEPVFFITDSLISASELPVHTVCYCYCLICRARKLGIGSLEIRKNSITALKTSLN